MSFECDRCGKCCRTHRVPVTHVDVGRLAELGWDDVPSAVEFLEPVILSMEGEPETLVLTRSGYRLLVLSHQRDERSPDETSCVFLSVKGCTIHPLRPSACRTYPFDRPGPNEPSRLGTVPEYVCPETTGVARVLRWGGRGPPSERGGEPALEQAGMFQELIRKRDEELGDYAQLVRTWNLRQKTRLRLGRLAQDKQEFLRFLRERASMLASS